jgi:hypothetical protein
MSGSLTVCPGPNDLTDSLIREPNDVPGSQIRKPNDVPGSLIEF